MADWGTRVAPTIELESPTGTKFSAKWQGDHRSKSKYAQRDGFPLIAGEFGKDLGSTSDEYTIGIKFDGVTCDLDADLFWKTCNELGYWTVIHPVYGEKTLQLIGVKETNNPVGSGGIVTMDTTWFEPLELTAVLTTLQLLGALNNMILIFPLITVPSFSALIIPSGFGGIGAIIGAANLIGAIAGQVASGAWSTTVAPEALGLAQDAFNQANDDLTSAINNTIEDTAEFSADDIGTAMSGMLYAPSLGTSDAAGAIDNLDRAADEMIAMMPTGDYYVRPADANKAYTTQLALEATVASACLAQTFTGFSTRTQAVEAAKDLGAMFTKIVNAFDAVQDQFSTLRADRQYYAQTESYAALLNIVSHTIKYLLQQTFDLAVEKRFTLTEEKTPLQICFEEFGAEGESKHDDFIEWNQLEGDDINILPIEREVVIYVETK